LFSFTFLTALRCSRTGRFTRLKCTTQWRLACSRSCIVITADNSRMSHHSRKKLCLSATTSLCIPVIWLSLSAWRGCVHFSLKVCCQTVEKMLQLLWNWHCTKWPFTQVILAWARIFATLSYPLFPDFFLS
jgi:hypothetical protein